MSRMLLIDDNPGDLTLMEQMLQEVLPDADIVTARTGGEALRLLREANDIDIVLVDHNMPGMDGTTFIHEVQGADLEVPVVLFTGSDDAALTDRALHMGAASVLVKPSSLAGFRDAARSITELLGSVVEA